MDRRGATVGGRRGGGFTLIDAMLAAAALMVLVGLLAAARGPATGDARLRAAARVLAADVDHARLGSIAQPDPGRSIVLLEAGAGYQVATPNDPDTPLDHPGLGRAHRVVFGSHPHGHLRGVAIVSHNLGPEGVLTFGAYGQPIDRDDPAAFTLALGAAELTITLDEITGEPRATE